MKRGFTLIELLVASMLLSMLVTILTMLFNQSSVAWRTGTAGVAQLQDARREIGTFHDCRDDALPGLTKDAYGKNRDVEYRTVSLFEKNSNKLRSERRAYERINWGDAPAVSKAGDQGKRQEISGGKKVGGSLFTVGVRSLGPDGKVSEDDITTWPDEVF